MWFNRIFLYHSSFTLERFSASVLMVYMHEDKKLCLGQEEEGKLEGKKAEKEKESLWKSGNFELI